MNDMNLDFRIFKGRCHSSQLSFSEISFFFAGTPKRRQIHGPEHMVLRKGNIGNFVFCRMAPSVMTSGDPESQNCSRFVLRRFFLELIGLPALMIAAKLGCYPSRDVVSDENFPAKIVLKNNDAYSSYS